MDGRKSNPENPSTTNVGEHISSSFLMPIVPLFESLENKHDVYRGKDCIKSFVNL